MPVQTQLQQRRGTAASWTSTNPTLAAGEIGFETDTGKFKIGNGSTAWAALAYNAAATAVTYLFNATSGQTTFSGADANGLTLAYTVGAEQVYLNGVLQVRGSDYTATNGTSIVLASGAITGDVLNVIAYSAMTITDTYTQAQANALFTPQANNFFAGKNKIINGDFGVWQRGTSITLGSGPLGTYGPDRFIFEPYGSSTAATVTRQTFTPGTAPVAGYEGQYFARLTNFATASAWQIRQRIENVQTFAGQTATFSFWAKASTSLTGINFQYVQNFGSGGSGSVITDVATSQTISTAWTRYSVTIAVPSISGKTIGTGSYFEINIYQGSGTPNSSTVDIWGWQVEAGSVATPFQTATGTLAGELAACQRYFQTSNNGGLWRATSTTAVYTAPQLPVQMRTTPSLTTTGVMTIWIPGVATYTQSSSPNIGIDNTGGATGFGIQLAAFSGLTSGTTYLPQTATNLIQLSAEL